jgi:hypothetical protein
MQFRDSRRRRFQPLGHSHKVDEPMTFADPRKRTLKRCFDLKETRAIRQHFLHGHWQFPLKFFKALPL